jgi:enoyl-CoA hydratase/carnithine racemase
MRSALRSGVEPLRHPAARLGIGYGVHGTNRLVATVGHAAAREIMFSGRRYSSDEALRWDS